MGLAISELYLCAIDRLAAELIGEFVEMVEWWAEKIRSDELAAREPIKFQRLRSRHYKEWVENWPDWNRQLAHMSAIQALSRLKAYRPPDRRPAEADLRFPAAVIHPAMVKIEGCSLKISVRKSGPAYERSHVKLTPLSELGAILLRQAELGAWGLGQAVLTRRWILLTFESEEIDSRALALINELLKSAQRLSPKHEVKYF